MKRLKENSLFVKLTKELKVEKTNLNKKIHRGMEWWNLLLHYSIPLLVEHGAHIIFVTWWSTLVTVTAKLNRKRTSMKVWEILGIHRELLHFVSNARILGDKKFLTSKLHSLIHTVLFVLRFGMFWNWSAKCFESALYPIKRMARDSKITPISAVTEGLLSWSASNLYSYISEKVYLNWGFSRERALSLQSFLVTTFAKLGLVKSK